MKVSAFCPGHISCVFQPVRREDRLMTGSRGFGIRLSLGTSMTVSDREGSGIEVAVDGAPADAPMTEAVVRRYRPEGGLYVEIIHGLPVGQGFATSASDAIAAAMCLSRMGYLAPEQVPAAAHLAEVEFRGGLGDVAAIMSDMHVPIRQRPGVAGNGLVTDAGFRIPELAVAVLGGRLSTASVLDDESEVARISEAGGAATDCFLRDPCRRSLFETANRFSSETGLESDRISSVLEGITAAGYAGGMCMLGNSVFTDAPLDVLSEIVGRDGRVFACPSGDSPAAVTRTE